MPRSKPPSRLLYVLVAGLLAGCLNPGDAGSGNNGAGNNGGSDSGSSTDAMGDTTPSPDGQSDGTGSECDCSVGQVCASGSCQSVDYLLVHATNTAVYAQTNSTSQALTATVFGAVRDEPMGLPNRVAEEGDCWVVAQSGQTYESTHDVACRDAGEIVVSGGNGGAKTLVRRDEPTAEQCYQSEYAREADTLFSTGQTLQVDVTGGSDIGEAAATIDIPDMPQINSNKPVKGQSVDVEWTAADSDTLYLYVQGFDTDGEESRTITCETTDDGQHTVPASLTEYLPDNLNLTQVSIYRINRTITDIDGSNAQLGFQASSSETRSWPE